MPASSSLCLCICGCRLCVRL